MNPYKLTGTPHIDHVHHDQACTASAAALTMAALTPEYDPPTKAATAALEQLSAELTCLAELMDKGTDLHSTFLTTWIRGMAQRAVVGVELASRVREAEREKGTDQSEAAE